MKRNIMILLAVFLSAVTPSFAQNSDGGSHAFRNKVSSAFKRARQDVENAGTQVADYLRGGKEEGLIRIKGAYYMPLYDVNLYAGAEAAEFRQECKQIFMNRYPVATVISVSLPQVGWVKEEVVKDKMVVGYMQTMYCYIIARDSDDGYINARFSYKRYKDAGMAYTPLHDNWPRLERADFLTPEVYARLLTK